MGNLNKPPTSSSGVRASIMIEQYFFLSSLFSFPFLPSLRKGYCLPGGESGIAAAQPPVLSFGDDRTSLRLQTHVLPNATESKGQNIITPIECFAIIQFLHQFLLNVACACGYKKEMLKKESYSNGSRFASSTDGDLFSSYLKREGGGGRKGWGGRC